MSIIVKHRTDLDVVAERAGVKLDRWPHRTSPVPVAYAARRAAGKLYGGMPEPGPPGFAARAARPGRRAAPRGHGASGRPSCSTRSRRSAHVSWTRQQDFREALAATIAKSQEDRRVFELVFDRFFFRAVEKEAVERGLTDQRYEGGERLDFEELRERIRDGRARGLRRRDARHGAARDRGVRPAGRGLWRDRRRRAADPAVARAEGRGNARARTRAADPDSVPQDRLREFERHLRRELERGLIERTQSLPPSKPLREFDRALPSGPPQDLAAGAPGGAQLKRRLATQGHEQRGRKRGGTSTCGGRCGRRCETGGVPVALRYRPKRPKRPELYVLCDVSTSRDQRRRCSS